MIYSLTVRHKNKQQGQEEILFILGGEKEFEEGIQLALLHGDAITEARQYDPAEVGFRKLFGDCSEHTNLN